MASKIALKEINIRIRSLRSLSRKAFRRDLYYRLNTVEIHFPPLRERREDILPLVEFYLDRYNHRYEKSLTLSEEAKQMLLEYTWPGNVREVMNVVESLVVLIPGGDILPQHLPLEVLTADVEAKRKQGRFPTLREVEREHILRVFYQTGATRRRQPAVWASASIPLRRSSDGMACEVSKFDMSLVL